MKRILIIVISLFVLNTFSWAQQYNPPVGTTVHNADINKFIGTWRWVSGNDTIVFKLVKENIVLNNSGGMDFIIGYHLYKIGTNIIESSMQHSSYYSAGGYYTITGLEPTGAGFKRLQIRLSDLSKNKDDNFELVLDSTNTQMQCTRIEVSGGIRFGNIPPAGYTLPLSFTLNKVIIPPPPPPQEL